VTSAEDNLIPEGYDKWPRSVQRRYLEELFALYFPERVQHTASAAVPQPGDDEIVEAEIID
jgi:hypothetical protein